MLYVVSQCGFGVLVEKNPATNTLDKIRELLANTHVTFREMHLEPTYIPARGASEKRGSGDGYKGHSGQD